MLLEEDEEGELFENAKYKSHISKVILTCAVSRLNPARSFHGKTEKYVNFAIKRKHRGPPPRGIRGTKGTTVTLTSTTKGSRSDIPSSFCLLGNYIQGKYSMDWGRTANRGDDCSVGHHNPSHVTATSIRTSMRWGEMWRGISSL